MTLYHSITDKRGLEAMKHNWSHGINHQDDNPVRIHTKGGHLQNVRRGRARLIRQYGTAVLLSVTADHPGIYAYTTLTLGLDITF